MDDREEAQESVDSPASEGEVGGGRRGRRGRKRKTAEMKVPRMKIKLIGRSDETDSPIFFAQTMEEVSTGSFHIYNCDQTTCTCTCNFIK